jgi:serine/threonine protein kinase
MLSKENNLEGIKIIDFGLSAQNFENLFNNDYCGTYLYMAPEQIEKKLYFISVDIWSIGIMMFMLLNNGRHPFYKEGDRKKDFVRKIEQCKIQFYNKVSPMAKNLIQKLLEPNPSWRYTAAQAIKHPWITRNINDAIPNTFNEILSKSNSKKTFIDLFNICLFMNYFSKNKYIIEQNYITNCKVYDEIMKKKNLKRKEKCLDISINEDHNDSIENIFRNKSTSVSDKKLSKILSTNKKSTKNLLTKSFGIMKKRNIIKSYKKMSSDKNLIMKRLSIKPNLTNLKQNKLILIDNISKLSCTNLFQKKNKIIKKNIVKHKMNQNDNENNKSNLPIINLIKKIKYSNINSKIKLEGLHLPYINSVKSKNLKFEQSKISKIKDSIKYDYYF